jgi:hypothetical protein
MVANNPQLNLLPTDKATARTEHQNWMPNVKLDPACINEWYSFCFGRGRGSLNTFHILADQE